jgi:hypothetical protein
MSETPRYGTSDKQEKREITALALNEQGYERIAE